MVVEGLFYTKEHEWAKLKGDTVTIGITEYAQKALGEITFVELPSIDAELFSGEELAVVESSKAASDVYSPVDGTVVEVNEDLVSEPELINKDCYDSGWICKVTIKDRTALDDLMDASEYEEYLKEL
jgi:glycine cleavage system H protein